MAATAIITSALSFLGSIGKSIFNVRNKQAAVLEKALDTLGDVAKSDAERAHAASIAIMADARSEGYLTRSWRPLIVIVYTGFVLAWLFGYTAPNLLAPEMPPILARIFDITEIVILAGYPARTLEKVMRDISLGKVINKFMEKFI